ncbi:MAG: hypothetical protein WBI37_06325 [Tepidanaerobacteraceae bacterium]
MKLEIQDNDGIFTFLSLGIFDKYLEGKLINDEDDSVVRPSESYLNCGYVPVYFGFTKKQLKNH